MAASLNDIYKTLGQLTAAVEGATEKIGAIERGLAEKIDANERRNSAAITKADTSRANMHRRLDDLVARTTNLETNAEATQKKVEHIQSITDGVSNMTQRAIGAGTLGQWVIKIGGWVVSGAAGFAAAYTWLTGRPPP